MGFDVPGRDPQRHGRRAPARTTHDALDRGAGGRRPPPLRRRRRRGTGAASVAPPPHHRPPPCASAPGALVLVSVPGRQRAVEAMDALDAGARRDALQRQRAGRAGGRAQAGRGRARAAGHGPRLRHRRRRRARPRVRQRRRSPARSASSPPPAPAASSCSPSSTTPASGVDLGPRRRRPRPLRGGRRPLHPRGAAAARRRRRPSSSSSWCPSRRPPRWPRRSRRTSPTLGTPVELGLLGPGRPDLTAAAETRAAPPRPRRARPGRSRVPEAVPPRRPGRPAARALRRRHPLHRGAPRSPSEVAWAVTARAHVHRLRRRRLHRAAAPTR